MDRGLSFCDHNFSRIQLLDLWKIEVNVPHLAQNSFDLGKLETIPRYEENVL
jgi:hypothetical protein